MKILFVGSLVSGESMEYLNSVSKKKASVAPVNYETMLIRGLSQAGAQVECLSIPPVAAYPGSRLMFMPDKMEKLDGRVDLHWLPFCNIQGLKQSSIERTVRKHLKNWLEENKNEPDKLVFLYSIYPPYAEPSIELCRAYNCHVSTVITDLPEYMYTWRGGNGLARKLNEMMRDRMMRIQDQCDSYVLFTEKMAERMGVEHKPFMVSEGFSDVSIFDNIEEMEKYSTKTVIYAGNLSRLYGIRALVDGFMQVQGEYELHLYGAGEDEEYIKNEAEKDKRIKFFGRVSRDEVLRALKRSHLIVINKPTADDYSNYSFSSKILECMASGTPVLTTRVGGMPQEYYDYFYFIDDETVSGIAQAIDAVMMKADELMEKGRMAREFAIQQKNYVTMTAKIAYFLNKQASKGQ